MAVNQSAITAQLLTQVALVNASISTVGSLANSSPITLKKIYQTVQNALAPFDDAIAAYDDDIDITSVGGVVSGLFGPQLAAALLEQATDVAQQSHLIIAEAFVSRVGTNIINAPG